MKNSIWPVLCAIRFFLSIVVVACHFFATSSSGPIARQLMLFSGPAAVICFLMISGFSIAASFEREREGFYFRRAVRILPLYIPCIVLSVALSYSADVRAYMSQMPVAAVTIDPIGVGQAIGNLCFLQGVTTQSTITNGVVWSISVEVFFYLIAPLLLKTSTKALGALILFSAATFLVAGWMNFTTSPLLGINFVLYAWPWILGFAAYRLRGNKTVPLVLVCFGVLVISFNRRTAYCEWAVTWVISCLAIVYGSDLKIGPKLSQFLSCLGDMSYPLYLFHVPIFLILGTYFSFTSELPFFALAIGASYLVDRVYDKPMKLAILAIARRFKAPGKNTPQAKSLLNAAPQISA